MGAIEEGARIPLWRDRVLRTAMAHADEAGLEGFTMRRLAQLLDVVPMALYRHVANKDDLMDGMVDLVFAEVELPHPLSNGRRGCVSGRSRCARRSPATRGPSGSWNHAADLDPPRCATTTR